MDQVPLQWIALPQNGGYIITDVREVMYCKSDGNYTIVYASSGEKYTICRKLKEVESLLPNAFFVRIHHGVLVNLFFVRKYHRGDGGEVELKNGLRMDVSRRKKKDFMDRLIVV